MAGEERKINLKNVLDPSARMPMYASKVNVFAVGPEVLIEFGFVEMASIHEALSSPAGSDGIEPEAECIIGARFVLTPSGVQELLRASDLLRSHFEKLTAAVEAGDSAGKGAE